MPEANEPKGVRVSDVVEEMKPRRPGLRPPKEREIYLGGKVITVRPVGFGEIARLAEPLTDVFTAWSEWAGGEKALTPVAFVRALLAKGKGLPTLIAALGGMEEDMVEAASVSEVIGYLRAWFEVNDIGRIAEDFFAIKGELGAFGELLGETVEKGLQS